MPPRFVSQQIQVKLEGDVHQPVSFRLEGNEYVISEILAAWVDYGFGSTPSRYKKWWQRHHRNYYRVSTSKGEIFEIYYDRGVSLENAKYKKWYVSRQFATLQEDSHE